MTKVRVTLEFDAEVTIEDHDMHDLLAYDLLTPEVLRQLLDAGVPMEGARYVGLEVME